MNNLTETQTTIASKAPKTQQEFHNGNCTFRRQGHKWAFKAPTPTGGEYTVILTGIRGGFETANRIASLVEKDVKKTGSLGSNRANIQRLIDARQAEINL